MNLSAIAIEIWLQSAVDNCFENDLIFINKRNVIQVIKFKKVKICSFNKYLF